MDERRKHKRYIMPRGTFVILRNSVGRLRNHLKMSIGEIAMVLYKSQHVIMGQVTDASYGGIGFDARHQIVPKRNNGAQLDLLMAEHGIYLHNLPYTAVFEEEPTNESADESQLRRNAFHFIDLDAEHRARIKDLLSHHLGMQS